MKWEITTAFRMIYLEKRLVFIFCLRDSVVGVKQMLESVLLYDNNPFRKRDIFVTLFKIIPLWDHWRDSRPLRKQCEPASFVVVWFFPLRSYLFIYLQIRGRTEGRRKSIMPSLAGLLPWSCSPCSVCSSFWAATLPDTKVSHLHAGGCCWFSRRVLACTPQFKSVFFRRLESINRHL